MDVLLKTLVFYSNTMPGVDVFIVDNGRQQQSFSVLFDKNIRVKVYAPYEPMSVAASWNYLLKEIYSSGYKFAFILNDDVRYENNAQIVEFIIKTYFNHFEALCSSQTGFESFILPEETFKKIGPFDEKFKGAYFEDKDYEYRIKLAKLSIARPALLTPRILEQSASIKKDPSLNNNYESNWKYYQKKWGGTINGEQYKTPFNK